MNGPREGHGRDGHYGPSSSDESSIEMKVPNSMVGLIIGKGGENIQKMQAQCGIHVQVNTFSANARSGLLMSLWSDRERVRNEAR
jgi:transcription antitermination factor NusA-like protein